MTTTYDPHHPAYFEEADLREELTRAYDLCHGCRMCVGYCTAFPTLFDFVDNRDQVVEALTAAEQDQVVDECFNCKMCFVKCPYIPPHEWELDFPRLMLRAQAVRVRKGTKPLPQRIADQALSRTDLAGKVNVAASPVVNKLVVPPGTPVRKAMEKVLGIASQRVLQPYARERFSTWFRKRVKPWIDEKRGRVAVFPTCLVEYQAPAIGKDAVRVLERNGVECSVPDVGCCGAPWLHAGDVDAFRRQAAKNLPVLADMVRAGNDVVVPQPTCGFVLKNDYRDYVGGPDAELVASRTYDAAEYLWKVHKERGGLDTDFHGEVPATVTYHAACHLQAQRVGLKSRDLLKLTGAKVTVVAKCSSIDGTWGYRAANYPLAKKVAQPLARDLERAGGDVICGDCHLANGSIREETGRDPENPLSLLARAYGIPEE